MELLRMVPKDVYKRSEKQFKEKGTKFVTVWYGYPTDDNDIGIVFSLYEDVKKDFPRIKPSDVKVVHLGTWQTDRHFGYTCLVVPFTLEKFLEFRDAGMFEVL